jgi:hypothetical protein
MSTKNLQAITYEFLTFPAIEEMAINFTYNEIFLYVRSLWSHGFLSDENALSYLKELKMFTSEVNEDDRFPKEADQFIFLLGGGR